ncbi:FtsX-like permease family protein [Micromonospora echinofusca]|uniref:ABC transporter permease n=1 Tax=Micromonospora echinofusca TaxID=47858 RepID=A0ABS3VKU8_MICEH|nr:FtsX-like permease family protein [Micromonospora echinofusca]MBO4205152.1 ABC transporter permease [Micromonospora echinofusca]
MKLSTTVRLALAGTRTDVLRVLLTGVSAALAALAVLAALTVLAIPKAPGDRYAQSEQYANALLREPGLRPGVAFTLLLLTLPVLALAGQCARLGAPARDRRLAAIRLAGATPGQAVRIAATETGVAALLGTLLALALHLLGRRVLDTPDTNGLLTLPTDVLPPVAALVAVVVGLPLLAALVTGALLGRVVFSPFGVYRQVGRSGAPRPWPGLLIGAGVAAFLAVEPLHRWYAAQDRDLPVWLLPLLLLGGGLLAMLGVVLGTGWLSYHAGRLLHRVARGPAALLAARRLLADPWTGSRTFAALLACLVFGAGAAGIRAQFVADRQLRIEEQLRSDRLAGVPTRPADLAPNDFYVHTMDLVHTAIVVALIIAAGGMLISVAEGVVARRRAYAALVATGVPRSVLGRAVAWQSLAPAVPAVLLALTAGTALSRSVFGEVRSGGGQTQVCDATAALCADPATREQYTRIVADPVVVRAVPVPLDGLVGYGAGALCAVLVTVGVGLLLLRSSTDLAELRAS